MDNYEACLLTKDFVGCKQLGMKLISTNTHYLSFALLSEAIFTKPNPYILRLLRLSIEREEVSAELLGFLAKRRILEEHIPNYLSKVEKKTTAYYITLKHLFIRGLCESKVYQFQDEHEEYLNYLLDNIDDWELYEYAMAKGLKSRVRESMNYKYYRLEVTKDMNIARELILKNTSFPEIKKILGMVGYSEVKDLLSPHKGMVGLIVGGGINVETLKSLYEMYIADKTFLNTITILSGLICTREDSFLILALCIPFSEKDSFPNNYEIALVFLFLCRYFCFYPKVLKTISDLSIRSIQQENFGFVWSDLNILLNLKDHSMVKKYKNFHYDVLKGINGSVTSFIGEGRIYHAISLLELREQFEKSMINKEIEGNTIINEEEKTAFSGLLGDKCSYLFAKITPKSKCSTGFGGSNKLMNIYNIRIPVGSVNTLIDNPIARIRADHPFIGLVGELVEYQKFVYDKLK